VEVLGELVQGEFAHGNQRVILLAPGLGDVEGVNLVAFGLGFRHDLHLEGPGRVVAVLDVLVEVTTVVFGVGAGQAVSFCLGEVANALVGLEVVLHPETLTFGVNPLVGVGGEAVHFTVGGGQTAVTEQPGYLVCRFRGEGPEVPAHLEGLEVGVRGALLGVNEVGELDGITDEEHGGVVAHHVVVALFGVELEGETAWVALRVGGAFFAGDGGEAGEDGGLLAGLEEVGGGVGGNVFRYFKDTECTGAFSVDDALWGAFAVEVGEFVNESHVVESDVALLTLLEGEVIGGDGSTGVSSGGSIVRNWAETALNGVLIRHDSVAFLNRIARCEAKIGISRGAL